MTTKNREHFVKKILLRKTVKNITQKKNTPKTELFCSKWMPYISVNFGWTAVCLKVSFVYSSSVCCSTRCSCAPSTRWRRSTCTARCAGDPCVTCASWEGRTPTTRSPPWATPTRSWRYRSPVEHRGGVETFKWRPRSLGRNLNGTLTSAHDWVWQLGLVLTHFALVLHYNK